VAGISHLILGGLSLYTPKITHTHHPHTALQKHQKQNMLYGVDVKEHVNVALTKGSWIEKGGVSKPDWRFWENSAKQDSSRMKEYWFFSTHKNMISVLHDILIFVLFFEMASSPLTPQNLADFERSRRGGIPSWVEPYAKEVLNSSARIFDQKNIKYLENGYGKGILFICAMIGLKIISEETNMPFRVSDIASLLECTTPIFAPNQMMFGMQWYARAEIWVLQLLGFNAPCTGVFGGGSGSGSGQNGIGINVHVDVNVKFKVLENQNEKDNEKEKDNEINLLTKKKKNYKLKLKKKKK
jgi:hypothetical protein